MKVLGVLTVSRQPYVHSSFAIVGLFLESAIIWSFVQYQNSIDRWHPMMLFLNCNNFAKALFWWCVYKGPRVLWWWCFFFLSFSFGGWRGKTFLFEVFSMYRHFKWLQLFQNLTFDLRVVCNANLHLPKSKWQGILRLIKRFHKINVTAMTVGCICDVKYTLHTSKYDCIF